jgi:sarcosine oxidase subunit beta
MSGLLSKRVYLGSHDVKDHYDVVIIGGGGHGLATAYYLAEQHGITDVAVFERSYIGSGGTGRNTTVIRSNYIAPETVPLYQKSVEMYQELSRELDFNVMVSRRGLLWLAHSEGSLNSQQERASINQHFGVETNLLTPEEIHHVCPEIDLQCGERPILGGAYHTPGAVSRHDAVAWGYAAGAHRRGVHIHQGVPVTNVLVEGGRAVGVETPAGKVTAGAVHCAVGGFASTICGMIGIRLPLIAHPLQVSTVSWRRTTSTSMSRRPLAARFWSAPRSIRTRATRHGRPGRSSPRPRSASSTCFRGPQSCASCASGPACVT